MRETDDAHDLVSEKRTRIENLYADYANSMKAMANEARKAMLAARHESDDYYSKEAREEYASEYSSILAKLNLAKKNVPRERLAQTMATKEVDKRVSLLEEMMTTSTKVTRIREKLSVR